MCINFLLGAVAQKYHKKGEKFKSLKQTSLWKEQKFETSHSGLQNGNQ